MPDFNPGATKGAPPPASYVDATGARFYGAQVSAPAYGYAVTRVDTAGGVRRVYFREGGQGQLCLQPSGVLEVSMHAASGDGKATHVDAVPEWVIAPKAGSVGLSAVQAEALRRLVAFLGIK